MTYKTKIRKEKNADEYLKNVIKNYWIILKKLKNERNEREKLK